MTAIVSCSTTSYGRFGARTAVEDIRSTGLECIELPIRTAGFQTRLGDEPFLTTDSTLDDLRDVERLLEEHAVRVTSCSILSGNPLDPEVVAVCKRKLDLAGHFGVDVVVGDAGKVDDADQLDSLYGNLREIGDYAGKLGITVCFENHAGICQDRHGMLQTIEALDHPHLRLNFDTANIFFYNEHVEGEVALAKVCHYVRHIHLKDSQGEYQQWCFPALGNGGAVDFLRVLHIMRDCGFNGPYSIELQGIAGEPEPSLDEHRRRIIDSVQHLRACGYFD